MKNCFVDVKPVSRIGTILVILLFLSCFERTSYRKEVNFIIPAELHPESTLTIDIEQFTPLKFVCDIKGNIFVIGNGERLVFISSGGEIEELNIQGMYPCEIVDIATDGFDIFLLDKMNRKIWTITRKKVLKRGFSLVERPLFFDVSEKGRFAVIYTNKEEVSIFSKGSNFATVELERALREGKDGDLVFQNSKLYIADNAKNRIDIIDIYASSRDSTININSPTSIAPDKWGNLFIFSKEGLVCLTGEGKKKNLNLSGTQDGKIFLLRENIYILHPKEKRIYVFKIMYIDANSDISGNRR